MIARVLLPLPIDQTFDFLIPKELTAKVSVGQRVRVRFQEAERRGIIAGLTEQSEHAGPLEKIVAICPTPGFSEHALAFCSGVAEYYLAPLGLVANRLMPMKISHREERFFVVAGDVTEMTAHLETLSRRAPRQAAALRFLLAAPGSCSERQLREELGSIRGVLDSLLKKGLVRQQVSQPSLVARKTQFKRPSWISELVELLPRGGRVLLFAQERWDAYLHLINATLASSRKVLVLAPEILLARQLHTYLGERLRGTVDLYHSNLPEGERGRVWERARLGQARLIVGTRSALFLPLDNLGLVILDEEQDRTYKQDEMLPYYHARAVALERGKGALVLFGSFAPSLETFHAVETGDLALLRPEDTEQRHLMRVVDMKGEKGVLSETLIGAIDRTLAAGKRVLLGVNRRGYFQATLCKVCGRPLRCSRCGVNLTYQVKGAQLVCRLCGKGYEQMVCPHCGSRSLRFVGAGSQRVEEEVSNLFPNARVARVDMDTLRTRAQECDVEQVLTKEADILVATPMIAKGPPLPGLELVGAIGVDAVLARPDFRAAERTYQYLIGLAGRLEEGEVIVQTYYPDHFALLTAVSADYDRFYEQEIIERQRLFYPPFSHLARLSFTSRSDARRRKYGEQLVTILRRFGIELLGPVPHPVRSGCDYVLIKGQDAAEVRAACIAARQELPKLEIDLDPDRI